MSCDYHQLPHQGIQTLQPYVPGKSIEELAREQRLSQIIKMASNENPLGCSPHVLEALTKASSYLMATYPSPAIHPLRKKLSDHWHINEDMLMLSNGSDLLFSILLKTFALHTGKHILTHQHAFISYQIQAQTLGIPVEICPTQDWTVDINQLINRCNEQTAIIFIANPNNPTGLIIDLNEIQRLLSAIPASTLVVLDEAYYEYAYYSNKGINAIALLNQFNNLVITRTFSKAYGLAGLRLGYVMAHPEIINLLLRVQLPFSVNQLAMLAGEIALTDEQFIAETLSVNQEGMQQLKTGLESMGLICLPSWCNFITFDCKQVALPIYQALLQHGIIVRPLKPYNLPNHLRVSIGKKDQNTCFLNALAKCLQY